MGPNWSLISRGRYVRELLAQMDEMRRLLGRTNLTEDERSLAASQVALLEEEILLLRGRNAVVSSGIIEDN